MLYQGKTLKEIAGYDDLQMLYLLFRPRDQYGQLVGRRPPEFPPGVEVDTDGQRVVKNPVGYATMFRQVMTSRFGLAVAARRWQEFLANNPAFNNPGVN